MAMKILCQASVLWALSMVGLPTMAQQNVELEREITTYSFINPLLDCGVRFNDAMPFRMAIKNFVDSTLATDNTVSSISVYFRQLNDGYIFGINEHDMFSPASMLKVPIMVTVLKLSETVPGLLQDKITFEQPDYGSDQYFGKNDYIQLGQTYSTDTLLYRMICNSDNEAMSLIGKQYHNQNLWENFYARVGINTHFNGQIDFMSIRQYAAVFRLLYNASYLSRDNSEYALWLLSKTTFKDGIRAGVDKRTPIANKYGVRTLDNGLVQLHDCGIVYLAGNHYILGVMTRGDNANHLSKIISYISATVYNEMSTNPNHGQ